MEGEQSHYIMTYPPHQHNNVYGRSIWRMIITFVRREAPHSNHFGFLDLPPQVQVAAVQNYHWNNMKIMVALLILSYGGVSMIMRITLDNSPAASSSLDSSSPACLCSCQSSGLSIIIDDYYYHYANHQGYRDHDGQDGQACAGRGEPVKSDVNNLIRKTNNSAVVNSFFAIFC